MLYIAKYPEKRNTKNGYKLSQIEPTIYSHF